jgi:hypothetical protein
LEQDHATTRTWTQRIINSKYTEDSQDSAGILPDRGRTRSSPYADLFDSDLDTVADRLDTLHRPATERLP